MKRFVASVLAGCTAVLALSFAAPSGRAGELPLLNISGAGAPAALQAGFYFGLEKGIFDRTGVDLRVEPAKPGESALNLVTARSVDAGLADMTAMALAIEKGAGMISLGTLVRETPYGVLVPAGSGIKTAQDLAGKEILFAGSSAEGQVLAVFLRAANLAPDKINLVDGEPAAQLAAYAGGKGMGLIAPLPIALPLVDAARKSEAVAWRDVGVVLPSFGLVALESAIRTKREAYSALAKGFFESWTTIAKGREDEAAAIVERDLPGPKPSRAQIAEQIKLLVPYFSTEATRGRALGWQSDGDWAKALTALEQAGMMKPGRKPTEFFSNSFVMQ